MITGLLEFCLSSLARSLCLPVTVLLLLVASCAHSGSPGGAMDTKECRPPTPEQGEWLDTTWRVFRPFVRVCPVHDGRSRPVLLIVSVFADLYYAARASDSATVSFPKPLIYSPKGQALGEFPMNYPDDPPHELIVRFPEWKNSFPGRIEFLIKSPTAAGDQSLPSLIWDQAAGRFVHNKS